VFSQKKRVMESLCGDVEVVSRNRSSGAARCVLELHWDRKIERLLAACIQPDTRRRERRAGHRRVNGQ
jgi:hypothetical protein